MKRSTLDLRQIPARVAQITERGASNTGDEGESPSASATSLLVNAGNVGKEVASHCLPLPIKHKPKPKGDTMKSIASEGRSDAAFPLAHLQVQPPTVQHVLTAVNAEVMELLPVTWTINNVASQPRALLALLVYHYSIGVLSSRDIEVAMWSDPQLRLLCRDEFPDWRQLRRFRRLNREPVRRCLARVLNQGSFCEANSARHVREATARSPCDKSGDEEADQRISTAILLDNMMADD